MLIQVGDVQYFARSRVYQLNKRANMPFFNVFQLFGMVFVNKLENFM